MTTDQFQINVKKLTDFFENEFSEKYTLEAVMDMVAEISRRVINTQTDSKGNKFGVYSSLPTLVGRKSFEKQASWDTVYNKAKSKAKQESKSGEPTKDNTGLLNKNFTWVTTISGHRLIVLYGGYKEVRRLDGHLNTNKDFSRYGNMWREFGIKEKSKDRYVLGGTDKQSQDKINWNSQREKQSIIFPNEKEMEILADSIADNVMNAIKNLL